MTKNKFTVCLGDTERQTEFLMSPDQDHNHLPHFGEKKTNKQTNKDFSSYFPKLECLLSQDTFSIPYCTASL